MTAKSLDVFSLRDSVVEEYKRFATSLMTIHAQDTRQQVEAIYAEQRYWPEPLIQIDPNYKRSTDVAALVKAGALECVANEASSLVTVAHRARADHDRRGRP